MNVNKAIKSALEHHRSGDLQQAENIYREILKDEPNNYATLHFLGILQYQLRNYDSAIEYIEKALQINPEDTGANYNLGLAFKEKGELDKAIACYQKAVQLDPNFADAYYNSGTAFQEKGQYDEAVACYEKALRIDPNLSGVYYNLGIIFQEKGQYDEAITYYQKALQFNPSLSDAYNNLGLCLQDEGKINEAIGQYKRALHLNPYDAKSCYNMANAFVENGQIDEAINYYQKALQLNPRYAEAYSNLASVLQENGQIDEAINCCQKALQIDSGYAAGYDDLINALKEKGKLDDFINRSQKKSHMSILISIPAYNRRKITQLSLAQTKRYKTPYCHLQVFNDHSTEYDNSFLIAYADEVIKLPDKMGIHNLRSYQFRKFLETDYDLIYMTDNDVIHDPQYITVLEALYEMGDCKLPVCIYNTIFHMQQTCILYEGNGIFLKRTAPGLSMFFDRRMVGKIVSVLDSVGSSQDLFGWDYRAIACLDLPWITSEKSYLEHYGGGGIHNDDFEKDRAINPTQYIEERRESILKYLMEDSDLQINF
jgi:tetratricopeptide (TPR) repeat protein